MPLISVTTAMGAERRPSGCKTLAQQPCSVATGYAAENARARQAAPALAVRAAACPRGTPSATRRRGPAPLRLPSGMEDKDQWVGVAPCVRAGIRSLLRRFEDQQAALDEAAKSQAALLNAHARSEARCEALEAQIVAARREATEARRIAAESSTNVASLAADLAKRCLLYTSPSPRD